jgi:putative glutamine amidotransferase
MLLPNSSSLLKKYIAMFDFSGFVLTGGNSPVEYSGDAPERDEVDEYLISYSTENDIPLLGVCRGMQSIQQRYGNPLETVASHVTENMKICTLTGERMVNSYHSLGSKLCNLPLLSLATSKDDVIKAIKHQSLRQYGIMWHPERNDPFDEQDVKLLQQVFN